MKGEHNINRAQAKIKKRDSKRTTKMKVSGKSVFTIAKLKDKTKK